MAKSKAANKFVEYENTRQKGVSMLKDGKSVAKVASSLGVSRQTVYNWIKRGFGEGAAIKPGGRPRKLNDKQRGKLKSIIERKPVAYGFKADSWTGERIAKVIKDQFKVAFNPKSIPQMLRNWGWEWRKSKAAIAFEKAAEEAARKKARAKKKR